MLKLLTLRIGSPARVSRPAHHTSKSRAGVPFWLRPLLQLGPIASAIATRITAAYNALVLFSVPSALRDATNAYLYERSIAYQPGGRFGPGGDFDGLFAWEEELLSVFPEGGRLLLGGAGSGRELTHLAARGFTVVAFEPSPLVAIASDRAKSDQVLVVRASYQDLADGVLFQVGPLVDTLREGPFDGVILGWGSLSHLLDSVERSRLLAALRRHSPQAPVVASFLGRRWNESNPASRVTRARFNRLKVHLGRSSRVKFLGQHGFVYPFTKRELQQLAADHGYVLDRYDTRPYPHTLFMPLENGRLRSDASLTYPDADPGQRQPRSVGPALRQER